MTFKYLIKLLLLNFVLSVFSILYFSYNYHGEINLIDKTIGNYLREVGKYLKQEYVNKETYIFKSLDIMSIVKKRYFSELNDLIDYIIDNSDSEVALVYLPLGNNIYMHRTGSRIFKDFVKDYKSDRLKYFDVYDSIDISAHEYIISKDDWHLSSKANTLVANYIYENILADEKRSDYKLNSNLKKFECFFPKNLKKSFHEKPFWGIRTNSQGCRRNSEINVERLKNSSRVLLIGDSISVPWSIDYEKGFPYLLENISSNLYLVNLAINTKSVRKFNLHLTFHLHAIQPNVVLIQVQIAQILNYFFDVIWNKKKSYEIERNLVNKVFLDIKKFLFSIAVLNTLFFYLVFLKKEKK